VILSARGGKASTVLSISAADDYYPRSSCAPKNMTGITLRFSTASFFYAYLADGASIPVCRKITTISITGMAKGIVEGP
jgi:hypothetical protein